MLNHTILDRYIGKQILLSWFAVFIVLILITTGTTSDYLLSRAAEGSLPTNVIFTLLSNTMVRLSVQLVPVSLFIGALFAFGRLYKDSEMVSMFACGVTYKDLYRPLFIIVVPLAIMSSLANFFLVPGLKHEYYELMNAVKDKVDVNGIVAGRFTASKGENPSVFFMEKRDEQGKMHHVFLHQPDKSHRNSVETSLKASYYLDDSGRRFMLFEDGIRYEGKPGDADYRSISYKKHGVYLEGSETANRRIKRNEIPTSELWGSKNPSYIAELHWRFSIPMVLFVLSFLAVPFSHTSPRKGRFSKMGPAILIYILYSNLLIVGSSWLEKGTIPGWLGLWWVHSIFILLGLVLLMKHTRFDKRVMQRS